MGTTTMLTPGRPGGAAPASGARHDVEVAAMGGCARLVVMADPDGPARGRDAADLAALGAARLADLEARWSRTGPDSELARLPDSDGTPRILSPSTYALVERAILAGRLTDRRCDRTAPGRPAVELVPGVGAVRLARGAVIAPGAVGRGFAADLVAAELLAGGAAGVLVDVDGNVRVGGRGPADGAWVVEVAGTGRPGPPLARLALADGAVATGVAACRGRGLASVTVLAADAWRAAALATGALAAGAEGAATFLAEHLATALVVRTDGTTEHVGPIGGFLA